MNAISSIKKLTAVFLVVAAALSCKKNENTEVPPAPSISVGTAYVTAVSAVLEGQANPESSMSGDLSMGFQYSKSSAFDDAVSVVAEDVTAPYCYSAVIAGLEPATKYYWRSVLRKDGKDNFGETKEFTTKELSSLLATLAATDIEPTSAVINAGLNLADVPFESLEFGFRIGETENGLDTFHKCREIADNAFSLSMTGLPHKKQYFYQSFLKLDDKAFHGEIKSFTTGVIPVTSVELNRTDVTTHTIGATWELTATVLPEDATDKSVTWSTSNADVATVDENGVVRAVGNGSAVITVTTVDQGLTATSTANVFQYVTKITLQDNPIPLQTGGSAVMPRTIEPDNAYDKSLTWTSSDESVATVDQDGKVTAVANGVCRITATSADGSNKKGYAVIMVFPIPEAVDLGLSVKWASLNLGASAPEELGDYFAWGDVRLYYYSRNPILWNGWVSGGYTWDTYKWAKGEKTKLTKYCSSDNADYWAGEGSPDGKTVLDPEDDAAHVLLGGKWRLPTREEMRELLNNCTSIKPSGSNVVVFTSKSNGNSIRLPASGRYEGKTLSWSYYACYWTSTVIYCMAFSMEYPDSMDEIASIYRLYGLQIRPVTD